MRCLHDSETVTFYHYIETPVCIDQHLHVNVFIMASDSWKHNGQRTLLHAHAYSCTGCQGEVGGGCALLHSSVSGRVTMETGYGWKQQEKEIMGFASPPLMNSRFCHCLYMVVFKEHPCKL